MGIVGFVMAAIAIAHSLSIVTARNLRRSERLGCFLALDSVPYAVSRSAAPMARPAGFRAWKETPSSASFAPSRWSFG